MHKTRAINVIRAAARMRLLGRGLLDENGQPRLTEDDEAPPFSTAPSLASTEAPEPLIPQARPSSTLAKDLATIKHLLTSSWFNVMLACIPFGFISHYYWGVVATFLLNFFALIPLALILGDVTEDLALRFGDVIGGLLNATFGNVVEMILSVVALQKGLYEVVAMSLLGSILSNLLLVLGCCFLFGGYYHKVQNFNENANRACNSLLFLSAIGIIIPTAAKNLGESTLSDIDILAVSRGTAVILLFCYGAYLLFQLKTHKELFCGEDDEEEPSLSIPAAMVMLGVITVIVAFCSEFLCGSIEELTKVTGVSQAFLGMIVLPIAGNACEHITAVVVATKDKMDLALGVAVGSSIQIAIFAIPFVVCIAWAMNLPFALDFDPFATLALTIAVIHANFVTADASSHWLMGIQLVTTYLLIGLTFIYK